MGMLVFNHVRWECRQEAQAAHASQHQEHMTQLERLRAQHEAELEQLAEQMMQLEARLDEATAGGEAHAAAASNLQERLEQQEDQAKAAAAQARATACHAPASVKQCVTSAQRRTMTDGSGQ